MPLTEEEARLAAHAAELFDRARAGEVTGTAFLTRGEQKRLAEKFAFAADTWILEGGYAAAERCRMIFLPDYFEGFDENWRLEQLRQDYAQFPLAVRITGSGYRTLAHKDYLGAVLNLGIARSAIGDVCVTGEAEAVLFCDRVLADFLCGNLTRVANDAGRVSLTVLPLDFDGGRHFEPLSDTVASPRADAVVSSLCRVSREKAQDLLREKRVFVDDDPLEKSDKQLAAGAIIVIRGYGKFIIRSLSDVTKKGRIRLLADRYL